MQKAPFPYNITKKTKEFHVEVIQYAHWVYLAPLNKPIVFVKPAGSAMRGSGAFIRLPVAQLPPGKCTGDRYHHTDATHRCNTREPQEARGEVQSD